MNMLVMDMPAVGGAGMSMDMAGRDEVDERRAG
jgi:hypothetical protein